MLIPQFHHKNEVWCIISELHQHGVYCLQARVPRSHAAH
jgi:hypothetical protein